MPKAIMCLFFSTVLLTPGLFAEKDQDGQKAKESLEHEIVVTANRIETSTKEIASSVTVITREQLEETKKTTVMEALEDVLALHTIQNGPPGSASSVFIRGANSEHTLVMIDGMELNDPITPSRSFDMSLLLVDNIDRIEIIRGPQSTLYGSDGMGGVINIITRQTRGRPEFHLSALGGSYGTYSGNAELSGSTDRVRYALAATLYETNGFSAASTAYEGNKEADGHRNLSWSGRLGVDLSHNFSLDFSLRRIGTKTDIDNAGGGFGDDPNHVQEYDTFYVMGQARSLLLQNRWEQILRVALVDYNRTSDNPVDELNPFSSESSEYTSKLSKIEWQNNFYLHETNTLTLGLDFQREQGESWYRSESAFGPYESIFPLQKAHNLGLFLQDQVRVADQFFLTAGLRYDNHSQAESALTFRIAPVYFIDKTGTKLKATLGTGFKAPSLYQLFAPGTFYGPIGNENLEPEKSTSWDAGIEQYFLENKLMLGFTYFDMQFENLIDFDFLQGYINIKNAFTKGTELVLEARPAGSLSLLMTYTRLEAKDKDSDEYLLRRPKDKFTVRLNVRFLDRIKASFSVIHVGQREDTFYVGWTSTQVTMDSYTLLHATGSCDILEYFQAFIRLDNILNAEYETVKGYGTAGFSAYGGIKINF